jgi:fibronectin-binding autotransporter adhesin
MALTPALTRIKNNQITDNTIIASSKIVPRTVTGGLLSDPLTYSGNVSITGNLTVQGTTTTIDTVNSVVADPLVVLNRNAAGANTYDIGFVFERGSSINTAFIWDEANEQFALISTTEVGTTQGSINNSGYLDLHIANLVASGTSSTFGNIQIGQNTISSVNTNGNINLTPNGTGEVVAATLSVSDLTSGRVALIGTSGALVDDTGITYSGNSITLGGNLGVNGGNITTTSATANVFAANATTLNIGASGGNVITGGDLQLGGNDIRESGGNVAITLTNTNVEVVGDLAVTGGDITTAAVTATIFNANATTLSIGNAATTLYLGDSTGNVVTNGDLQITGNDIRSSTGNVAITLNDINANIAGNLNVADDLAVNGGDITTTQTTANIFVANATTLNIGNAATATYIGNSAGNVTVAGDIIVGGNDIRESGGNVAITLNNLDVTVAGDLAVNGGDITTTQTTATIFNANTTTLSIGNAATTTYIGATGGNVVTGGDIQLGGDSIRSSTGNIAMQLNDKDVTVLGNLTVQGTRTEVGTSDLVVSDSLINLHTPANLAPLTADDGRDIGLVMHYFKGGTDKFAFFGWANDSGELEYYSDGIESNVGTFSGQYGTIKANIYRSMVSTGTAPLIVSSTTQVANLNVAVAGNLVNGNSNVLVYANSDIAISANGVSNVAVISYQGANITGWANISGNIDTANNINTTNATVNIANANTTTLYIGGAATATYLGASGGNVTIGGDVILGGNDIRESGGNVTITLNNLDVTVAGDLAVNGGDITTDDTTATIFNANVTTLSIGNAATTAYVGAANGNVIFGGDIQLSGDSIRESGSNVAIQLTNTNVEVVGDLAVNGGDITTTQATGTIFNANVTSLSIGNAATGVFIGNTSNTGTTQISGNLTVTTNIDVIGNADLSNLRVQDITISSIVTNANINIDPNGTGSVVLNSTGDNSNVVIRGNSASGYGNLIYADAVNGRVGFLTDTVPAGAIFKVDANSSVILPVGNTATRPSPEVAGMLRYNTTISSYEFWDGSKWQTTGSSFTIISTDALSGDGSTVAFTLSQSTTTAGVIVAINGIVQQPTTAYTVSGTTLTFTEAPLAGDEIDARVITTTSTVSEIAQNDSSIAVTDTGSNGTITLTADGTARLVANTAVNINGPIVPITSGTSVGLSATVIDSFDKTIYRSAKYVVQVSHASAGYEVSEVLVVHNGTTATQAQYGVTFTGAASLGATSVGVNGSNIELKYTGVNSANTVKIFKEYIRV